MGSISLGCATKETLAEAATTAKTEVAQSLITRFQSLETVQGRLTATQAATLRGRNSLDARREALDKRITAAEQKLAQLIQARAQLGSRRKRLMTVLSRNEMRVQTAEREQQHLRNRLQRVAATAPTIPAQAELLYMLRHSLCTYPPITLTPTEVNFSASDVHIRDPNGDYIPYSFGDFGVRVKLCSPDGYSSVSVYLRPEADNTYSEGFVHPHIQEDGYPCLGNAKKLLLAAMEAGDYLSVIATCLDFLSHYNPADPYHALHHWVADNEWDNAFCPNCGGAYLKDLYYDNHALPCGCPSCDCCGKTLVEQGESLSGCGAHASCCINHHRFFPSTRRCYS